VSRVCFDLPRWSRRDVDAGDPADSIQAVPEIAVPDFASVLFAVGVVFVLTVAWIIVLPALFMILGVVVAALVLLARLLSLKPYRVEARSRSATLTWWVKGPLRSARAVRALRAALMQGGGPQIDGRPPDVVEAHRV